MELIIILAGVAFAGFLVGWVARVAVEKAKENMESTHEYYTHKDWAEESKHINKN